MEPAMGVKKTGFSYGEYQTWDTEEDSLPVGLLEGLIIELGPVFKDY